MAIQYGDVKVSWLGHCGFLVEGSKRIYVDPFQIDSKDKPPADYLLITHPHYDHLSVPDIERIVTTETVVICPPDCASKLMKFRMKQLKTLEPGSDFEEGKFRVMAVPAYNTDKPFHPRENDWLGYVFTLDEVTFYHAGDTDRIPEMSEIECNVALLPVSGTYVMSAEEAAQAVDLMEPDVCVPMHWGSLVGTQEDADRFKKLVGSKSKVVVLERE